MRFIFMLFSESHEWVQEADAICRVGITDFAQKELGDIVYVELPKVGAILKQGKEVAVLESTKAAADVYSPVSGRIVSVNERLVDSPDLINTSPETEGWIYTIELSDSTELKDLMNHESYQRMVS